MISSASQPQLSLRGVPAFRHRVLMSLTLGVFLAAIYMVTYSGWIEIGDQWDYFDATGSVVRHGDLTLDLTMLQLPPDIFPPDQPHPFRQSIVDPLLPIAAAPLYWLAEHTPGLGLVHTTYLFNIFISAALGVVMCWYGLALGYSDRTAVIGALCLGVLTIVFPYSQTFFREQLLMLLFMIALVLLEHWRTRRYRSWILPLMAVGFLLAAYFAKDAVRLVLPAIVALMLPDRVWKNRRVIQLSNVALVAVVIITVISAYTSLFSNLSSVHLFGNYYFIPEYTQTAFHTYLFSVGGSIWGTSPIVLFGFVGGWLLWKKGEHRLIWAAVITTLAFCYGYALLRGEHWFGGTIWPQRFLLPTMPLLMLPVYAGLEQLHRRPVRLIFIALAAYSLFWQFSGLSYSWHAYSEAIYEESFGGLAYWLPGFNELRYIRPFALMEFWGNRPLNFAWVRADLMLWAVLFGSLAILCAALIRRWLKNPGGKWLYRLTLLSPVALLALTAWGLFSLYRLDPAYMPDNDNLRRMVEVIRQETRPNDIVMLEDARYRDFFANYGKVGSVYLPVFPYHPGERGSFEQPLLRESDNPNVLVADYTAPIVHHLADHHARLYLLTSGGPEIPWSIRAFEKFMAQHYYRVRELRTAADVRLVEYVTVDAPDAYSFRSADTLTDLIYTSPDGETIELAGFTLPSGVTYAAGDALSLSLYWRAPQTPEHLYIVAWFVAEAETGIVKAQGEDSWHGGALQPSTTFKPNMPVWDHRALVLPSDLPAGEYELLVVVYEVVDGVIQNLNVTGEQTRDEFIGILPVRITVEN